MKDEELKRLAVQLTYHCVRNTVIEDYHADGKLSQADMKALNKEVVNKLYTALGYLFGDNSRSPEREHLMAYWDTTFPDEWDEPETDTDIQAEIALGLIFSLGKNK